MAKNEYKVKRLLIWLLLGKALLFGCTEKEQPPTLFEKVDSSHSGVNFRNDLSFDKDFNIFTYRNFYNGGGVALGDINNDGMLDIYLTSNQGPNKLYLNKGNFVFEDISEQAGVEGNRAWSTGVAMADVNGDGWLDIYVCNSGDIKGDNKENELFINNGDGTFTEKAEEYGLMDRGFSTHAVFFDYDNDGDLDCYLLNNSYQAIGSFNKMQNERPIRDPLGGDKLFRNDGGKFTDVSEEAGIFGSVIGFGLGITVGDVNQDGWMDIFISNDFFERDYLYINNQDGTFTETLEEQMRSISAASMGADIADINNNGLLDIFVTDMLPEPRERLKQITTFEDWDKFQHNKTHGYHYQYNRNMLHINNGDGTFSELGRLANVEATDWSWGALIFDMDNDGLKDLFVANGIYQDITDLDYLNFIGNEETMKRIMVKEGVNYKALVDPIPINPVSNYAFLNQGNLSFTNKAWEWGLGEPIHSNGAAYGDLNNDGTLDLVINNVNAEVSIFKNRSNEFFPGHHFIQIQLMGKAGNLQAVGAQVSIKAGNQLFYQEQMPNRGFQSSVDPVLTFGLGEINNIDEISIRWPDGKVSLLKDLAANQRITVAWEDGEKQSSEPAEPFLKTFHPDLLEERLPFQHIENDAVDFDRDRLTYHMFSSDGPKVAIGDVNGDGLEDLYIGGARGQAGQLFLLQQDGKYQVSPQAEFEKDRYAEDTDAVFFDANGNGFLDLVVTSGGNEAGFAALELADRLYVNDGKGNFTKSNDSGLNPIKTSSSCVKVADLNGDGYMDMFIGTLMQPHRYGVPASSYVWINDGKGRFKEASSTYAPELAELGMVTDAAFMDLTGENHLGLVVVGHWMSPVVFNLENGKLTKTKDWPELKGWYKSVEVADLNGNGKMDLIIGNHGLNSRFKASPERPIRLFTNDFDQNGSLEHLYTQKGKKGHTVFVLKHELEKEIPSLKKRFLKYSSYNDKYLEDIFSKDQIETSIMLEANHLESFVLVNQGSLNFEKVPLPWQAQKTWVYSILVGDFNKDGISDILLGGNLSRAKPEAGKYDAGFGEILLGKKDGDFTFWPNTEHGLNLSGDVRDLKELMINGKRYLLSIRNNDRAEWWIMGE